MSWQGVLALGQVSAHVSRVTVALYRGKEMRKEGSSAERNDAMKGEGASRVGTAVSANTDMSALI